MEKTLDDFEGLSDENQEVFRTESTTSEEHPNAVLAKLAELLVSNDRIMFRGKFYSMQQKGLPVKVGAKFVISEMRALIDRFDQE